MPDAGRIAVFDPSEPPVLPGVSPERIDVISSSARLHADCAARGIAARTEPGIGYAAALVFLDRARPADEAELHDHGLGLIAELFGRRPQGREARRATHFLCAQAWIADHLGDPALSAAAIAAALNISQRHLNRVFAREGTTVRRSIEERRLQMARQMLEDPDRDHLGVGEIAFACGFSDQARFSREFRRAFGATPSGLRRDMRRGAPGGQDQAVRRGVALPQRGSEGPEIVPVAVLPQRLGRTAGDPGGVLPTQLPGEGRVVPAQDAIRADQGHPGGHAFQRRFREGRTIPVSTHLVSPPHLAGRPSGLRADMTAARPALGCGPAGGSLGRRR
ncbi:helix-turn-helix transcriptional regulator [Mangrovicoccus ximenensis]|uniref:helix-turn-helix transcriptional regulator n=1 Tax=Mangrovicoccus ximenensis TaxID=1911570 RepID=UPI0013753667|nr:helix-turn-helix transcriptional regulator [Mangrovicoccus ximenensis]